MTTYKTLVAADVYRDGGSIEARFMCADGGFETVWLQAALEPQFGMNYIHTDLLVFADAYREGPARRIAKNSPDEESVLYALNKFLSHPEVNVPFSEQTPDEDYLQIVETLVATIPSRLSVEPDTGVGHR